MTQLDELGRPSSISAAAAASRLNKQSSSSENTQLSKMQGKLVVLREQKQLDQDRVSNLIDLNNKFDLIEVQNMEFYGQRQLTYMMRSLFYEKQLVNSNYSIMKFVKAANSKELEEDSVSDIVTEESAAFDEVMTRGQTAKSFKEFYR